MLLIKKARARAREGAGERTWANGAHPKVPSLTTLPGTR